MVFLKHCGVENESRVSKRAAILHYHTGITIICRPSIFFSIRQPVTLNELKESNVSQMNRFTDSLKASVYK